MQMNRSFACTLCAFGTLMRFRNVWCAREYTASVASSAVPTRRIKTVDFCVDRNDEDDGEIIAAEMTGPIEVRCRTSLALSSCVKSQMWNPDCS
jgi:hypothetical protein